MSIFVNVSKDAEKAQDSLNRQTKETGNQFNGLLGLVGKLTAAYLSYAAVKRLVVGGLEEESNYERLVKGFTTLTGSVGQATEVLDELRQYSLDTGFDFDNIAEGAKKMTALGFTAGQAVEAIKGMGDEVKALGGTDAQLNGLIQRIGIIKEIGILNTRVFRQFASEGIDAYKIIADETGRTVDDVKKLTKAGALDVDNTLQALVAGMANHAKQAAGATQVTLGDLWDRIVQRGKFALLEIGKAISDTFDLKAVLKSAIDYIDYFTTLAIDVIHRLNNQPVTFAGNANIADQIAGWIQAAIPVLEHFWEGIKTAIALIWATAKDGFLALVEFFRQSIEGLLGGLGNILKQMSGSTGLKLLGVNPDDLKSASDSLLEAAKTFSTPISNVSLGDYLKEVGKIADEAERAHQSISDGSYSGGTYGFMASMKAAKDAFVAQRDAANAAKGITTSAMAPGGNIRMDYSPKESQDLNALYQQISDIQEKSKALELSPEDRDGVIAYEKEKNKLIKEGFDIMATGDEADAPRNAKAREYLGLLKQWTDQLKKMEELRKVADDIGNAFGSAFDDFVTGAKSAKAAFQDLAKSIEKIILDALVTKPLEKGLSNGIFGLLAGLTGTPSSPPAPPELANVAGSWKGNIFGPSGLVPFALGGIVNGPTLFPFARGTGLMGERGPEAIMPLSRGPDGKLGVKSMGSKVTNVTMNVYTNDADSFRRSNRQIASGLRKVTGN